MPLNVYLSSVPQATFGATVSIEGRGVTLNVPFPPAGTVTDHPFSTPPGIVADLTIYFTIGNDQLRVDIVNLDYDGTVNLTALPNRCFLGGVFHTIAGGGCVVRCRSGQSGLNCVICTENGITARVCC